MDATRIAEYARQLLDAHGDKAEAEAAQKAAGFQAADDPIQAGHWQKIRAAIAEMRGPHVS